MTAEDQDVPEVVAPSGSPRLYTEKTVAVLAEVAGLPLPPQRLTAVTEALRDVEVVVHRLRDADLGETPPATAFDPRWL